VSRAAWGNADVTSESTISYFLIEKNAPTPFGYNDENSYLWLGSTKKEYLCFFVGKGLEMKPIEPFRIISITV
jgi:hypothetical protein